MNSNAAECLQKPSQNHPEIIHNIEDLTPLTVGFGSCCCCSSSAAVFLKSINN